MVDVLQLLLDPGRAVFSERRAEIFGKRWVRIENVASGVAAKCLHEIVAESGGFQRIKNMALRTGERAGFPPVEDRFHPFLRDHFTNQATRMDVRLVDVLAQVARRFRAARIEVVSGYRSPKYNLMLRKKGHQVARSSQHMEGHAVDFRIRGVPTPVLLRYVRSLRRGGVGYYPHSQFVHSDTGKIRFWKGS